MARAHASGIKVRAGAPAEALLDEPRVVVSVETNPRKVPTHRRLLEARAADARGTPGGDPTIVSSPRPVAPRGAEPTAARPPAPLWMRIALVLALLVLAAGVVRRARIWRARTLAEARAVAEAKAVAREEPRPAPPAAPPATATATIEAKAPPPVTSASAKPISTAAATVDRAPQRPRVPHTPAPPAKPALTPIFELPGEKAKDG
ncbi:Hypothetical protein A7982_10386 [Minicystis rosea]|nr:Hypothetical protein A7982_10386 [Minicystis rosea]